MHDKISPAVLCLPVRISTSFDATKILIVENEVDTMFKLRLLQQTHVEQSHILLLFRVKLSYIMTQNIKLYNNSSHHVF